MAHHPKPPVCTNCSYTFTRANNYCPECGQKNHDLRIPLKHLLAEVLESTLHFDSKSFTTVKHLLLKPGFLSNEFNAGKRAAYVPPVRLYILISFIFFFLFSIVSGGHSGESEHGAGKKMKMSLNFQNVNSNELTGLTVSQVDSLMAARNIEPTKLNRYMILQMQKIVNGSPAEFYHLLMKNLSYMMFLLMPLFGVCIYVFNRKRIPYYIDSLIISIHFHAYVFFLFTILLLASSLAGMELFLLLEFLIIPCYMLFMFRRVLKQGWFMTIGKTVIIGVIYIGALSSLLLLTFMLSIALM